jgi:nitrite reductase (NO-forming)
VHKFICFGLLLLISLILPSTINFIQYSSAFAQELVSIAPGAADPNNPETFVPPQISLSSGSTISWTNDDSITHSVTLEGNPAIVNGEASFDSGPISPGYTWDNTFDSPGQFDYHCLIHPFMTGKVIIN